MGLDDFTAGAADPGTMSFEDRLRFAKDLLSNLDAPETAGNVHFLLAWMAKENTSAGGVSSNGSGFNPLATTWGLENGEASGDRPINGDSTQNGGNPVQEYGTRERGLMATLKTLLGKPSWKPEGHYPTLVAALREGTNLDKVLADSVILGELQTWGSINVDNPQFGTRTGYSYEELATGYITGDQPELADDGSLDFRAMLLDKFPNLAAAGLSGEEFEAFYQNALDIVAEHGLEGLDLLQTSAEELVAEMPPDEEPAVEEEVEQPFVVDDLYPGLERPVYDGDSPSGLAIFNALLDNPLFAPDLDSDTFSFRQPGPGDPGTGYRDEFLQAVGSFGGNSYIDYDTARRFAEGLFLNFSDEMLDEVAQIVSSVTAEQYPDEASAYVPPAGQPESWNPVAEFGFMADFLNHPEIGRLLRQAADEGWDEQKFMDAIYLTDWWTLTETADIRFQFMESWQPAQATAMKDNQAAAILKIADRLDIAIDPGRLGDMARNSIVESWTADDMNRKILAEASWAMGEAEGGEIGGKMRTVGGYVDKYFVPHSASQIEEFARKLYLGDETEVGLEAYFANLAKGQYPSLATHIDRGYTVKQIFDPYAQQIAGLLEIPATSVDFVNDQRFQPIIDHIGSDNEHRPMTLWETGEYVRGLDDWQYTNNAKTSARKLSDFIGRKFGSVG
jgi:hypothetical protein